MTFRTPLWNQSSVALRADNAVAILSPAVPTDDDATLVARARGGERWAEEALYRRHVRSTTRLALRVLGRNADAEDVVQDAFATVFERLDDLRDDSAFAGWLSQTALNLMRQRLRSRRLWQLIGLEPAEDAGLAELASASASPEDLAELACLDGALRRMPAEARIAWVLRHVEGWQHDEIAERLGLSVATVKRRLARAEHRVEVVTRERRQP